MDKITQGKIAGLIKQEEEFNEVRQKLKELQNTILEINGQSVLIQYFQSEIEISIYDDEPKNNKPRSSVIRWQQGKNKKKLVCEVGSALGTRPDASRILKNFGVDQLEQAMTYVIERMILDDCSKRPLDTAVDAVSIKGDYSKVDKSFINQLESFIFMPTNKTQGYAILEKKVVTRFVLPENSWTDLEKIEMIDVANNSCCFEPFAIQWVDKNGKGFRSILHYYQDSEQIKEDLGFLYSEVTLMSREILKADGAGDKILGSKGVLVAKREGGLGVALEIIEMSLGERKKLFAIPIINWVDKGPKEIKYATHSNLRLFMEESRWGANLKKLRLALSGVIYSEKVRDVLGE